MIDKQELHKNIIKWISEDVVVKDIEPIALDRVIILTLTYLGKRGFLSFSDQPEIVFEEVEEVCSLKNESKKE